MAAEEFAVIYLPHIVKEITKFRRLPEQPAFCQAMDEPRETNPISSGTAGYDAMSTSAESTPGASNATLLGKLFLVPALVVCLMLGAAVVVILFGTSSMDKPASIDELITSVEASTGEREYGVLLPAAKESWQAAQELAQRFERKKDLGSDKEIEAAAARLSSALKSSLAKTPAMADNDDARRGLIRDQFLMLALAKLELPSTVPTFVELLNSVNADVRRSAMQSLASMKSVAEARAAIVDVYPLLSDPDSAVRMVACLTVAALANDGDPEAIHRVAPLLDGDREVQWNAATALAIMGSSRGKLILMNMLDRGFWEKMDLDYFEAKSRVVRKLSAAEVDARLQAAILAASKLDDADIRRQIVALRDLDSSLQVREAARSVLTRTEPDDRAGSARADKRPLARVARPEGFGRVEVG